MRKTVVMMLLLAGCAGATIDRNRTPPPDWPAMQERVFYRVGSEFDALCSSPNAMKWFFFFIPAGATNPARGCAVPNFATRVCAIYLTRYHQTLLEHEREHCRGYDHAKESTARDAWEAWKAGQR